ncbi:MAG: response regulator transcription factor [Anaerolineales bacterium]
MRINILWIDGKRAKTPDFIPRLEKKGAEIAVLSTAQAALGWLEQNAPDVLVVNAASLASSGTGICQRLRKHFPQYPILMISAPEHPPGQTNVADEVLVLPFTVRKLVNRLQVLIPSDNAKLLRAGEIVFDPHRNLVVSHGRRTHLTPRLAQLLRILIERAGTTIPRETLFTEAWETAYIEDTRTLDVHISWLRQALEEDPHQPRHLKTVRGVGYRLDA